MQPIPFIDIRESDPSEIANVYPERGKALIEASKGAFGLASRLAARALLPIGDSISKKWLEKTRNPYLEEITQSAKNLAIDGVYALNLCYEYGCTSGVYQTGDGITLARVLDWPFPALGESMIVAHQRGIAGDFYNITWPGMAGVLNAVAKGRFAAALNQAPMRRYKLDIVSDWTRNRIQVYRSNALPPSHLLRKAFEEAKSYEEAKSILSTEPVALPVIYILSGVHENEGCVIERLEDNAVIREMKPEGRVCAANHFESWFNGIGHGWLPRALESNKRLQFGHALDHTHFDDAFRWFQPPIANKLSRVAFTADAAKGAFTLMGTDGVKPVTKVLNFPSSE